MARPLYFLDSHGSRINWCDCGAEKQFVAKRCQKCYHVSRNKNPRDDKGRYTHKKGNCIECSRQLSDTYRLYCRSCSHKAEKNHKWKGGIAAMEGYGAINAAKRRLAINKTRNKHTKQDWAELKAKYSFMCLCCKKQEPEIKLTRDHIIPLSRGGDDSISNIQPLCRDCNSRKWAKTINFIMQYD